MVMIIAIDGLPRAGKSTLARNLSRLMEGEWLSTGSVYRVFTYRALLAGIDVTDEVACIEALSGLQIEIKDGDVVACSGQRIGPHQLRSPAVGSVVSIIAAHSGIRKLVTQFSRQFVGGGGLIVEGQDIGSTVLPDADYKFFLICDLDHRVARSVADGDQDAAAIALRELRDSSRANSPIGKAADAIEINSGHLAADRLAQQVHDLIRGA